MQHLQPNTTLQGGKYRIERVLGQGGFGNTYVGVNTVFNERVAIKEFFMRGLSLREGDQVTVSVSVPENKESFLQQKEKFKKEALRIRQLKNEHIVAVHDLFEENGTAYYVMDYVDGQNLADRLKITGKPIKEQDVRYILPQILDALKAVHDAGMWHLDLKPANIMLEKGGIIKLIDFGASKQLNAQKGGATTSTAISYTNGYAPREQMEQNYDKFGPWTDIYALGATLYNLLTNKRPPLPTDIDDDMSEDKHFALPFPEGVSDEMKSCVLWMMKTNRLQRPQSIDEIIKAEKDRKGTPKTSTVPQSSTPKVAPVDEGTIIAEPQPKGAGRKITVHPTADNSTIGEDSISAGNDDEGLKTWKILLTIVGIVLGVIIAIWLYMGYTIFESPKIESEYTEVSQIDVDESNKYDLNETIQETSDSNTVQGNNISEPKHTREKSHKEKGGCIGQYRIVGLYKVIKVEEGEDLATISRRYLGPGMEAFVELYNNIEASDSLTVGQKIRIPKLEWIKE